MVAWFGQKLSRNLLALWQCSGEKKNQSHQREGWERWVGGWIAQMMPKLRKVWVERGQFQAIARPKWGAFTAFCFRISCIRSENAGSAWIKVRINCWLGAEFRFELQLSLIQWSLNYGIIFEEKWVNVGSGDVCEKGQHLGKCETSLMVWLSLTCSSRAPFSRLPWDKSWAK